MAKKGGLGRGVNIFIPEYDATEEEAKGAVMLKLIDVEPNADQPRKTFDPEKLEALARSIQQHGVIQPIVVIPGNGGRYTIIAGERRWRASKLAGLKEIPAVIRDFSENSIMEVSLIENLQRENLNPIEEAQGYQYLMRRFSMTQEKISQRVGKSRSSIANSLRLLALPEEILKMIEQGTVSGGHAKAILSVPDREGQLQLAKLVADNGISVRDAEAFAKNWGKAKPKKKEQDPQLAGYFTDLEEDLSRHVGTKVRIRHGKGRGKIEIDYYSDQDLERIMELLKV